MIYAVDYDGTLVEETDSERGEINFSLVNALIKIRNDGNQVILWSCREGKRLEIAVKRMKEAGLEFDAINDNVKNIKKWGLNPRKIFAHYYIDNANYNMPEFNVPFLSD